MNEILLCRNCFTGFPLNYSKKKCPFCPEMTLMKAFKKNALRMEENNIAYIGGSMKVHKIKKSINMKKCIEKDECCLSCGISGNLMAHHIIAKSLGGDDDLSNLITFCFHCHRCMHDGELDMIKILDKLKDLIKTSWGKSIHKHKVFRWEKSYQELLKRKKL